MEIVEKIYTVNISVNYQSAISTGAHNFINKFFFNFLQNFVIHIIKNLKILIFTYNCYILKLEGRLSL